MSRRGGQRKAHSASLWVPSGESRRERRARIKAEQAVVEELTEADRAAAAAEDAERKAAADLRRQIGALGRPGPQQLRGLRRFGVRPHQASTSVLGAAYPFLAERGLGATGTLIGHDTFSQESFYFDPWALYGTVLTNPNALLAGEIGSGKSSLAKSLVTRSLAFGRKAYVPGDPKGEWTAVTETVGGLALKVGPGRSTRLNPLDEGHRPAGVGDVEWAAEVRSRRLELLRGLAETIIGNRLGPMQLSALNTALDAAVRSAGQPQLGHVVQALLTPDPNQPVPEGFGSIAELMADGRPVGHALTQMITGELAGIFEGDSTTRVDTSLPMVSIDLSALGENSPSLPLVMACTGAWMESAVRDPAGGQRWMVYDEGWRIMREPSLLRRMQSQWKLARAWGLANLIVVHRLSDFDAIGEADSEARSLALGLIADCSTRIIYTQKADQLTSTAEALGLSSTERSTLPNLSPATGLWRVGQRSFLVRHDWSPMEAALFSTDSRMKDNDV